jgi:hypothetical protein
MLEKRNKKQRRTIKAGRCRFNNQTAGEGIYAEKTSHKEVRTLFLGHILSVFSKVGGGAEGMGEFFGSLKTSFSNARVADETDPVCCLLASVTLVFPFLPWLSQAYGLL